MNEASLRPEQDTDFQKERKISYPFETTKVNGVIYDVRKLELAAAEIPIQEIFTENFRPIVAEGHYYWLDTDGQRLGPYNILRDWQAAQNTPAWAEHIATIKRANLNRPCWVTKDGQVFNGLHRLTRAFLDNTPNIKIRIFETLPENAKVEEGQTEA